MSDLLPSNARPAERALASVMGRLSAVPVPIRPLWNPQTCPVHLLPWLAWSMSVEAWDPEWPEYRKRSVIASAIETARRKGTKGAVLDALAALGASAKLTEWFELDPPGEPHTFRIDIVGNSTTTEMQDMMLQEVNRTKPLRSHFEVTWGTEFAGSINTVGVLQPLVFLRIAAQASTGIVVVDAVLVTSAGTAAANGLYVFRGMWNGRPFYTKSGSSPYVSSITWWNDYWGIVSPTEAEEPIILYASADSAAPFPWEVDTWISADGALPIPTVTPTTAFA